MSAERYTFIGVDQRGNGRGGDVTIGNPAEWTRKKFETGWAKLRLDLVPTRTDRAGRRIADAKAERRTVAEIRSDEAGARVWWSE